MNGGALVICDPHGAQSEESLARSCDALAGAFLFPPAIDHDSILALIRQIDRIGRDRLSGHDTSTTPILLLIDEFTSLARNHPQAGDIVNALLNFGDEYRKVNLMAFLIGHHWRGDLIDPRLGSSLRSAIGARVIHRSAPNEARFLLQSEEAQGVDRLLPGHVLFFDASDRAQRLAVPYVDGAALAVAARYIPDHPEWPMPCPDLSESAGPAVSTQDRTADRDLLAALLLRNGLPVRQVASIVRDAGHTIDNNRLSELREVAAAMHNAPDAPVALQEGSGEAADATHEQSGISCPHCGNQLESNAHLGAAKRHGYCKHCKPNRQ
jgi:hypothetical protein